MTDTESISTLKEMAIRGKEYKEDSTFEMYGEEVTAIIQPLPDGEFIPLTALLMSYLDIESDDIERDEVVEKAVDEVEAAEVEDGVDMSQLDDEFVDAMQRAAIKGLYGGYDSSGDEVEYSDEEAEEIVREGMLGGLSVELGRDVLELSGSMRDAEKFPTGRGS